MRAAGVMFVATGDRVLLMRRAKRAAQDADHAGDWAFPGGGLEGAETPEQAARRETQEETGYSFDGKLIPIARSVRDGVEFTTFLAQAPEEFVPILNDEHDSYQWVKRESALTEVTPLHPGVPVALRRPDMNELDIARAMRDGDLASPVRYMNLMLCAMRITGTELSYRTARGEFVWRDPSMYMTEDFLDRCNGLPVIYQHPDKNIMNTAEFKSRIAGSIFLPYLREDAKEVWGIAKIHDMEVADELEHERVSTSPGVAFRTIEETGTRVTTPDGRSLLIEGEPSLLDHLAICGLGVWDKGGPAAGVSNQHTETVMDNEAKSAADAKLDAILDGVKAMKEEMDSIRKDSKTCMDWQARKDAEEKEKMDAARKDAEDKEKMDSKMRKDAEDKERMDKEEKEKMDAAARKDAEEKAEKERMDAVSRADAEKVALVQRVAVLEGRSPAVLTEEDKGKYAEVQMRCDAAYQAWGEQARPAMQGESLADFRVALLNGLKKHSKVYNGSNLGVLVADEAAFGVIQGAIIADAIEASNRTAKPGSALQKRVTRSDSGHIITRWVGDPAVAWAQFSGGVARFGRINIGLANAHR